MVQYTKIRKRFQPYLRYLSKPDFSEIFPSPTFMAIRISSGSGPCKIFCQ